MGRRFLRGACAATVAALGITPADAAASAQPMHPEVWPAARSRSLVDPRTEAFVDELIGRMSLEEKVGQLIQADVGSIRPEDLREFPLGSILAGGDSPPLGASDRSPAQAWLATARAFRTAAAEARAGRPAVPLIFGIDA